MGELTGYDARGALAAATAAAGGARSTANAEFSGTVLGWDTLAPASRRIDPGLGTLLTEGLEQYTSKAIRVDGQLHQTRFGWRVYSDRLHIVQEVRPLERTGDGRLAPAGPWRTLETLTRHVVGAPTRTRGTVPAHVGNGPAVGGSPSMPAPSVPGDDVPLAQRSGAHAATLLPPPVRATAARAVPNPTFWLGQMVQFSDRMNYPVKHTAGVVRVDDSTAAVITAVRELADPSGAAEDAARELAATPWQVTQVVMRLGETGPALTGANHRQIGKGRR